MEIGDKPKALNVLHSLHDGEQWLTFDLIKGILERIQQAKQAREKKNNPLYTQRLYRF